MSRRLLAKLSLAAALCVLVIAGADWLTRPGLPLRKGMNRDEVHAVWGEPAFGRDTGYGESFWRSAHPPSRYTEVYIPEPDALGNQCIVSVDYDGDEVVGWEVKPLDRTTPPWVRRIAKALGW